MNKPKNDSWQGLIDIPLYKGTWRYISLYRGYREKKRGHKQTI